MQSSQSTKNIMLTPAVLDLGLGDQLKAQVDEQEDERRKKMQKLANQTTLGAAATALFGIGSPNG
jgi:hypothetical protein